MRTTSIAAAAALLVGAAEGGHAEEEAAAQHLQQVQHAGRCTLTTKPDLAALWQAHIDAHIDTEFTEKGMCINTLTTATRSPTTQHTMHCTQSVPPQLEHLVLAPRRYAAPIWAPVHREHLVCVTGKIHHQFLGANIPHLFFGW